MREKIVQEKNFYYIKLYNIYIYTEYICINNQDELKFVFLLTGIPYKYIFKSI